jgi:HD superfamily phosphohydrolase
MEIMRWIERPQRTIRIPEFHSVPLPEPFAFLVDHPDMQRLRRVRQLGPIHWVYPGAVHTRFEHSLGVFWAAIEYLRALLSLPIFRDAVNETDVKCLLAAALLHDVGHYPFAHNLEALHCQTFPAPRHEDLAAQIIIGERTQKSGMPTIADHLSQELGVDPERVAQMVKLGPCSSMPDVDQLLASVINSAIDCDKLDYLERDSVHMGVPYGRMPDRRRLLSSLTVNIDVNRLAIGEKGRVSAESFFFCRYLMFSEAYWHHTVRAVSAMVEGALNDFVKRENPENDRLLSLLMSSSDDQFLDYLVSASPEESATGSLLAGLTNYSRVPYKRLLTLNRQRAESMHHRAYDVIYKMNSASLAELKEEIRGVLFRMTGVEIPPTHLLVDTPPRDKDQMENVDMIFENSGRREVVPLSSMSRVCDGIAWDFIKVVKKIRLFVHPQLAKALPIKSDKLETMLLETILNHESGDAVVMEDTR